MDAFWTWNGWTAVGSIATVLALATLVFATAEFVVKRRQVAEFMLDWAPIATAAVAGGTFHVFEFHNFGRGAARLVSLTLCGARAHIDNTNRAPEVLGAGSTFTLLVTSPDLEQAWVRYVYSAQADRRRFVVEWHPLMRNGAMADELSRQENADDARPWIRRAFYRRRVKPVAPGGVPFGVVIGRDGAKTFVKMLQGPSGAVYREMIPRGTAPVLAYVPETT
jgi:hypothetical protein